MTAAAARIVDSILVAAAAGGLYAIHQLVTGAATA
jgi:hypothetical protein